MRPELVVLDMAGTTVYDGDAVHRCLSEALRGVDVPTTREEINGVMGIPKPTAIRLLLEAKSGDVPAATGERVDAVFADFQRRMLDYYRTSPEVREVEGASAAIRTLRENGLRVALDTGFDRTIADTVLERLGWTGDFLDATVTSDEVDKGRPHPDMIFRAMQLTGVAQPERVAKVGDTPADLQEGIAAGCRWVIGVTGGSHTREELALCPHTHLIASVAELPALLIAGVVAETGSASAKTPPGSRE
jgi:phosphonatase-like hydrolase